MQVFADVDERIVGEYEYTIYTGSVPGAGTENQVRINICGDAECTGKLYPDNSDWKAGSKHTFKTQQKVLGLTIQDINIGHDGHDADDSWFLEKVEIYDSTMSLCYMFLYYDWIDLSTSDCLYRNISSTVVQCSRLGSETNDVVRLKSVSSISESQDPIFYMIDSYDLTIITGIAKNGGTDAQVRITLCGENGCTGKHYLRETTEDFKLGSQDAFKVDYNYLGRLDHIRIGHDNSGKDPSWFLQTVKIYDNLTDICYVSFVNHWIDIMVDDCLYKDFEVNLVPCDFTTE